MADDLIERAMQAIREEAKERAMPILTRGEIKALAEATIAAIQPTSPDIAAMVERIVETVVDAANIVTCDGYYEIDKAAAEKAVTSLLTTLSASRADAFEEMLKLGRELIDACDQMIEDINPIFAEMQFSRGRAYTGKQIGSELEAFRKVIRQQGEKQ